MKGKHNTAGDKGKGKSKDKSNNKTEQRKGTRNMTVGLRADCRTRLAHQKKWCSGLYSGAR